ncbi:MAG: 6-phosphogluconate dehydrogenase [Sulfobacillus acidophilus]|uniref:6-phosphogluconate dehydrogenase n=1 Tax=Sulfobacillus acidophilus TaxID=53633 RepID=A0A2T2WHN0_9FIRM|nr:MAG: 6-phosphogluconate dehydrogenase [Sulfobacillus acidophilus]
MEESLGFIGLGVMGQAMALHLVKSHPVTVYNRTRERCQPLLQAGAQLADTPAEVASRSRCIFLMLKDDAAVSEVVEGSSGVFEAICPGTIVVDHSTISPASTRRLAHAAKIRNVQWLDAPVTGGDIGAREATLTIMVGGEAAAFEEVQPYLKEMGRRIVYVGAVGQGQTLKLVANLVSGINLMAASEGVRLGLKLGLSWDTMDEVMSHGTSQSYELSKIVDRMRRDNFVPGFSVENRYKDLKLALELARQVGFNADLTERAEELYREHWQAGYGQSDEASYVKRWDESE